MQMARFFFALAPALLGIGFLLWSRKARIRVRYSGEEEDYATFAARRAVFVFEGVGLLALAGLGTAVLVWAGPPVVLSLMIYVTFALLVVSIVVTIFFPGIMRGRS